MAEESTEPAAATDWQGFVSEDGSIDWNGWKSGVDPDIRAAYYFGFLAEFENDSSSLDDWMLHLMFLGIEHDSGAQKAWAENFGDDLLPDGRRVADTITPQGFGQWMREERDAGRTHDTRDLWGKAQLDAPGASWAWIPDAALALVGPGKFFKAAGFTGKIGAAFGAKGIKASGPASLLKLSGKVASKIPGSSFIANNWRTVAGVSASAGALGTVAAFIQAQMAPEDVLQLDAETRAQYAEGALAGAPVNPLDPANLGPLGTPAAPLPNGQPGAGSFGDNGEIPTYVLTDEGLARARQEDNPYIGFEDPDNWQDYPTIQGPASYGEDSQPVKVPFRYQESNVTKTIQDFTQGQLMDFQRRAVKAGLIDADTAASTLGMRDNSVYTAMYTVMGNSNRDGREWTHTLNLMAALAGNRKKPSQMRTPFTRQAYASPDYATLAQRAKTSLRQYMGRDINDWELKLLTDKMRGLDRQEFDANESQRLETWRAEGRALDNEQRISRPKDVQQVDANARFNEFFQEKFAGEIDRAETTDRVASKTGALMAGLNRASGLIG